MANQSTSESSAGRRQSEIPEIRSFEFDKKSIGKVKNSVNQFRGSVSLPIDFVTLPGREGLDVKLSALYESSVRNSVETWNVEAPTGVLGLGWQMPFEQIVVEKNNSGSPVGDQYYLLSGGSGNPLVKTGESGGKWVFEARNYQFWDILYDPDDKVWTIVKENGFVYTYGGEDGDGNGIQWGVRWGNWIGSSPVRPGQERYPVAWNLVRIDNAWGDSVTYEYHNVERKVGSEDGLEFTQASYIKTIRDSYGRTVTFEYEEKYGALNPSPRGIVEFQAENAGQPEPNAYQDRYETLYLDRIGIENPQGEAIYSLRFAYDFVNLAPTSDSQFDLFWKRCLTNVWQESPSGETLPSMRFRYYDSPNDVNAGALESIVYPEGGVARFTYKKQYFSAPKTISIDNPLAGSTPQVWHGQDYVVFTYTKEGSGLRTLVCSWDGRWVQTDITAAGMKSVTIDPGSLVVHTQQDYIAVGLRNTAANRDEIYLYRKDNSLFGNWELYLDQPRLLPLAATDAPPSQIVAGSDYVIAYNPDYSGGTFHGFSYDWRTRTWSAPPILPSPEGVPDGVAVASAESFYIVGFYFESRKLGQFQIFYRDLDGSWNAGDPWSSTDFEVVISDGAFLFRWSLRSAFAAATYVTGTTEDTIEYKLRFYQWDDAFHTLNAATPKDVDLETEVVDDKPVFEIFNTLVVDSFAANNPANLRDVGSDQSTGSSANWTEQRFTPAATTDSFRFASGTDVAIMSEEVAGGATQNKLLVFDPNRFDLNNPGSGWQFPATIPQGVGYPTVSGNYYTIGDQLFIRNLEGDWRASQIGLGGLGYPESVQNRGPRYIAYQSSDDSSATTYLMMLKNRSASAPVALNGPQKVYVPQDQVKPGTNLAGPRFLVTYPASQPFDQATSLSLYNTDQGDVYDPIIDDPVAYVEIEDPYDEDNSFYQSYFYGDSDSSQIAYNTATGVAQYPLVYALAGVKSANPTPPREQPEGRTETYYSNGLSPQAALGYPAGWIYNYAAVLNGVLLAEKVFDSENNEVSSQLNFWQLYQQNAATGVFYYGGYSRLVQSVSSRDGVDERSESLYDATRGVELWVEKTYTDSEGDAKKIRQENRYAWQVPNYAATFDQKHMYTTVVETTQSVSAEDGGGRVYIESRATTYRNWATSGASIDCPDAERCKLAPYEVYQWTSPGSQAPEFDFTPDGARDDWLLTSRVVSRGLPASVIGEQEDVDGVRSSFIYDQDGRYLVAKLPNASLAGDEANYCGFEDYEDEEYGWSLGPSAAIIPDGTFPEVDAHTGERSVKLEPTSSAADGVRNSFTPERQDQRYVFSAWVKKPDGFDDDLGNASWTLSFTSGGSPVGEAIEVDFPATVGSWVYLSQVFALPDAAEAVTVEIGAENQNQSAYVLIDDLRFSPFSSLFEATGYDQRFWLPNARLGANGESARTVYDDFQQPTVNTNVADEVSKFTAGYFSTQGNQGTFAPLDPNHTLSIQPAEGGELFAFNRGAEWRSAWTPGASDVWRVNDALELELESFESQGTLSLSASSYDSNYALHTEISELEAVSQPQGVKIGDAFTVQWDPTTFGWQLLDGSDDVLATADTRLFQVPSEPFADQLDDHEISQALVDEFTSHGYSLSLAAEVDSPASGRWILRQSDNGLTYYLRQQGDEISVYQVPWDWLLQVGEKSLLFFAGGQLIFSHLAAQAFAATPQLFFGNRVAITCLASCRRPQAGIAFDDSTGVPRQAQALVGERTIVSQTITDNLGREAIKTKAAYVEPTDGSGLFAYREDFAIVDWETYEISGLVNDAYPEDGGYPYSREVFEASPLSRVVGKGMPGEDFKIGAHSYQISYGSNDGSLGLEPNQFYKMTVVDPNGDVTYEITSKLEQVIYKVSIKEEDGEHREIKNFTQFDDYGNPIALYSPNYYHPPANSTEEDWVSHQQFDYAGRPTLISSPKTGEQRFIYDRAGNVRFSQDPEGQAQGNYNYYKYDDLGRPTEEGYLTGEWNQAELEAYAENDPAWPPTPDTWRRKILYDGSQSIKNAIGRVYQFQSNNTDDGTADVVENFRYDIFGNTKKKTVEVSEYDAESDNAVEYSYDNLANITRILYPQSVDGSDLTVIYGYNELSQVIDIYESASSGESSASSKRVAHYTYNASGRPDQETLDPDGEHPCQRTFTFNSPLWIKKIEDQQAADQSLYFRESLDYTEGGYQGAAYYNGEVAAASYELGGELSSQDYAFQYRYDSVGQLEQGVSEENPEWSIGDPTPVSFDDNGNFELLTRGEEKRKYQYFDGTQRVERIYNPDDDSAYWEYQYNDNGDATYASSDACSFTVERQLVFSYDPGTKMTTSVRDLAAGGTSLSFLYGADRQRVLKQVDDSGQKLYVRGTNSYPLVERVRNGSADESVVRYIFGPGGMIAMHKGGQRYRVLKDHLGSVRMLIDEGGVIVASYEYLSFGNIGQSTEPTAGFMSYLYTGQEYDAEIGLYNYRARFYSSDVGRFLATDPLRQYFSPYIYASNNPVLYIDPTGTFSLGSLFSAIAGVVIGAVEILIGVAIDALAGVLEVVTGGLGTPAAVALASAAGAFYGAGVASIGYSVFNFDDFSWKDYGIQMGIGAAAGAISFGFGALGAAAAEAATGVQAATQAGLAASRGAQVANYAIETSFVVAGGSISSGAGALLNDAAAGVTPGADIGEAFLWGAVTGVAGRAADKVLPTPKYKAGWGNLGKRTAANVAKKEVTGIAINTTKNAVHGDKWDQGLLNTVYSGAVWGSLGSLQAKSATKEATESLRAVAASLSFAM